MSEGNSDDNKSPVGINKVKRLEQTCYAYPSQWEAETGDGRKVYIRYRSGKLNVGIGHTMDEAVEHAMSVHSYHFNIGDALDGYMTESDMKQHTSSILDW